MIGLKDEYEIEAIVLAFMISSNHIALTISEKLVADDFRNSIS